MPNKCCVVGCKSNYTKEQKCTVFKIPASDPERSQWIDALPRRSDETGLPYNYPSPSFVCINHWTGFPDSVPHVKIPGGSLRPTVPPFYFPGVPSSCIPRTPSCRKVPTQDIENRQLHYFDSIDKIDCFDSLKTSKRLIESPDTFVKSSDDKHAVLIFDFESSLPKYRGFIELQKKQGTLSDISVTAFNDIGSPIPLSHCLLPNNQLSRWSQLHESINSVRNFAKSNQQKLQAAYSLINAVATDDDASNTRLNFLSRQLELHINKNYVSDDYVFASFAFPKANYELLREYLILPSPRKMRTLKSGATSSLLIEATLNSSSSQQKVCALLIDEVKIRPSLIYQGHGIIGYSLDCPDEPARSALCIMMKCLHGGKSVMASISPLHSLSTTILMEKVLIVMRSIHEKGGHVLCLICDCLRTNVKFYSSFHGFNPERPWSVTHPINSSKCLYLLIDPVHILKSIRNNWITEKCKMLHLGDFAAGNWQHVIDLYKSEELAIVKLTCLTRASVFPSPIQRQNVSLVLKAINEKTIAALQTFGGERVESTINILSLILQWWKTVNVKSIGETKRFNDPDRSSVISSECDAVTRLTSLAQHFAKGSANNGRRRVATLTIDTHKALLQTTIGLKHLSIDLLENFEFKYVLLGELQQDRLEGEFGCWRQMCGGNNFMTMKEVTSASQLRGLQLLSKLEKLPNELNNTYCTDCDHDIVGDTQKVIENLGNCLEDLSEYEQCCSVYIAGYLVKSTPELSNEGPPVESSYTNFTLILSRGGLTIPSENLTFWVQLCILFAKSKPLRCHKRLSNVIDDIGYFYDVNPVPTRSAVSRLANVLLSGYHKRSEDMLSSSDCTSSSVKLRRITS